MPDPDETRTITGWRTASRFYRRSPGLGWWLALLAIPLLLGLLGWGLLDKSKDVDVTLPDVNPTISVPTVNAPNVNLPSLAGLLSIARNGNDFSLTGDIPDLAFKDGLFAKLKDVFGPNINLIDNLNIKAGVDVPDLSGLDGVLKAAIDIPDFNWNLADGTLTLTGKAPNEEVKASVEAAAKQAWPNAKIDNQIEVIGASPTTPAPAPAPAPAGECGSLQADITAALNAPINFQTDGFTLTAGTQQMLGNVADKIKACPDARISVDGFTDSSGNDGINIPLSANRAKSVADYLVSQGVGANNVTSQGHGSANPIASNDTAEGKAQNRRVEITVS